MSLRLMTALFFALIVIVTSLAIWATSGYEEDCKALGGHVETNMALHTGPVYDAALKKVIVKTTTTTVSWCESADGQRIDV